MARTVILQYITISMEGQHNNTRQDKTDYNSIPVYYCKDCGSLRILVLDEDEDYCDVCGSTTTGKASIEAWIDLQQRIYRNVKPIKYNRYVG